MIKAIAKKLAKVILPILLQELEKLINYDINQDGKIG